METYHLVFGIEEWELISERKGRPYYMGQVPLDSCGGMTSKSVNPSHFVAVLKGDCTPISYCGKELYVNLTSHGDSLADAISNFVSSLCVGNLRDFYSSLIGASDDKPSSSISLLDVSSLLEAIIRRAIPHGSENSLGRERLYSNNGTRNL